MLNKEMRQTIFSLSQSGQSNRAISRLLKISRNTVKEVLAKGIDIPSNTRASQGTEITPVLREVFGRCLGNASRIQEVLKEEYELDIAYSTLTRSIHNAELREPIKRVGEYHFEPGQEMQHDTSPHIILLGDKKIKAQCASLILGYSRKLFIQYYPCFTRFEAKTFLKAALEFMQGGCKRCIIDNTSVILAGGSGSNAVIAPEMLTLCRMFSFEFIAHRVNDPNRKGKIERPFYYIETNFLAGRTFKGWDNLNCQAKAWCIQANQKEKRILGMSPDCAFVQERPFLIPLPNILPPIYECYQRQVDSKGFINLDTNRYSVPEKLIGKTLDIYKYPEEVRIFYQRQEIAVHVRLAGKRVDVSRIPGHHIKHHTHQAHLALNKVEAVLRGHHEIVELYISSLKKHVRGSGHRQLNRLLNFKRTYPSEAFLQALKQAHQYGLYDLNRLEELIIKFIAGNYFNLNEEEES
jgi:transposase